MCLFTKVTSEAEGCRQMKVESSILFMPSPAFLPSVSILTVLISPTFSHKWPILPPPPPTAPHQKPLRVGSFEGLSFSEIAFPPHYELISSSACFYSNSIAFEVDLTTERHDIKHHLFLHLGILSGSTAPKVDSQSLCSICRKHFFSVCCFRARRSTCE